MCIRDSLYFVAYSLWKTKFWHQHLVGSVIPFLRLNDCKKEFFVKSKVMMQEHEEHVKHIAALKILEQKEKQFHENINLINDMRRVISVSYTHLDVYKRQMKTFIIQWILQICFIKTLHLFMNATDIS